MFKFSSVFFALALSQASASSMRTARQLSEELFITYEPQTTVTDHAAIDLDQKMIEDQLAAGTDEGKQNALKVYTNGAHSKSYATLTLASGLSADVSAGVEVTGQSVAGNQILGKVLDDAKSGDTTLNVQYHTSNVQESYVGCQVGANPDPVTDGCFQATGDVTVGALRDLSYSYNVNSDNLNGRTIQGFSRQAKEKMYDCPACPYATYEKYYNYYGAFDYANQWVLAAFNKGKADFTNGGADFSIYEGDGLVESIKKGTAYMNIWMYVVRELEDAIDDCNNDCGTEECNDDQVHAWDEAVAFYTGSLAKTDGTGVLLYALAQKRCENFGTCLTDGNNAGMASVNDKIFTNFNAGKQSLQQGKCSDAKQAVADITALMSVPLIQGAIRYAHIQGEQNQHGEKQEAEGAAFAAAVLPLVHACNSGDAKTIYDNLRVGSGGANTDFASVKSAFENNYDCLGVTCAEVGGLLSADLTTYFDGAAPCGSGSVSTSTTTASSTSGAFERTVGVAFAFAIAAVAALM